MKIYQLIFVFALVEGCFMMNFLNSLSGANKTIEENSQAEGKS